MALEPVTRVTSILRSRAVMPLGGLGLALSLCLVAAPARAQAQQDPPPQAEAPANQDDPTRAVFFSLRNEYSNLREDNWSHALIARSDRALLKTRRRLGGRVGLLTRIDVPIVATAQAGSHQVGLGDLYVQALYVPWLTRHFALAAGSGLTIPTATDRTMGTGKWQAAPVLIPVWFFPRGKGFLLLRLHEHVSFAGDRNRPDVNFLEVVPAVLWNFRPRWWTLVDTNTIVDWAQPGTPVSRRTGVEIGHVVARQWGLSVKPEIPWGPNRRGDWNLKVILTRYRRK